MQSLPCFAELRNGPVIPGGDEDRVVAEAGFAAPLRREVTFEHAGHLELAAVGSKSDEHGHHARAAVVFTGEPFEQRIGLVAVRRPARGVQTGRAVEGSGLDPRVLAEHPFVRRCTLAAEARLQQCVLGVRLARLLGPLVRFERLELPLRQSVA